jgi:hypothetical protein
MNNRRHKNTANPFISREISAERKRFVMKGKQLSKKIIKKYLALLCNSDFKHV